MTAAHTMRARPGLVAWDGAEYATTATSLRHVLVEPSGRAGHCTIQLPAHIIQTGLSTGITWAAHLEAIRQRVCAEREGKGHVLAGVCYRRRPLVYRAAKRSCVALAARTPQHNWVPASSLTNKLSNARMPWLQRASAPGQLGRGELQGRALLGTHKRPRAPGLPRAARLRCMPASKRRDGAPEQGRRTYAGQSTLARHTWCGSAGGRGTRQAGALLAHNGKHGADSILNGCCFSNAWDLSGFFYLASSFKPLEASQ